MTILIALAYLLAAVLFILGLKQLSSPKGARNVAALLQHLAPDGTLSLDWDDEITAGTCVTRAKAAV